MGGKAVSNLNVRMGADTKALRSELQQAGYALKRFQKQVGTVARSMGYAFGGVMVMQGIKNSIDKISEFNAEMSKVKAISGATAKEFEALKDNALQMGAATKFTAKEVASLQVEYAKLGFSSREIVNSTEATLALATATGEDLATAATVAGSTLRAFQLDAKEMGRVADVMGASFTSSALDLSKFAESMKYAAPVAKSAGVSIEFTTAMLSALADAGISGSMAGTSLRRILNEMAKTGKPAAEAFKEVASKGITLESAMDEVGRTAQTALTVLSANTDKVIEMAGAYENAEGAVAAMAATVEDNLLGDLTKLGSAWDGLIQKGGRFEEVLRAMTKTTTSLVNSLAGGDALSFEVYERVARQQTLQENINGLKNAENKLAEHINNNDSEREQRTRRYIKLLQQIIAEQEKLQPTVPEDPGAGQPDWIIGLIKKQAEEEALAATEAAAAAAVRSKNHDLWKKEQEEIGKEIKKTAELERMQAEGRKKAQEEFLSMQDEIMQSYSDLFSKMEDIDIEFYPDPPDESNKDGDAMAEAIKERWEAEKQVNAERVQGAINAGMQIASALQKEGADRKRAVMDILKQNAAMIISDLIRKAVTSIPFPLNIAAAGAASIAGGILLNKIPALAEGGIVSGPTLAMIGEGKHPEAVVPLPNGVNSLMGGANVNVTVEGIARGEDIHYVVKKVERKLALTR